MLNFLYKILSIKYFYYFYFPQQSVLKIIKHLMCLGTHKKNNFPILDTYAKLLEILFFFICSI